MVQFSDWIATWDRTSDLVKHQAAGVAVYERLNKFLLEFSKLQTEAFAAQRKLCAKYVIDTEKDFGYENSYGKVVNAFLGVVNMLIDSENLIAYSFDVYGNGEFKTGYSEQKQKLKHWKHDREKLVSEMKSQVRIIDEEIKRYRDKYREMVKSTEEYNRIESDKTRSQLDIEKALMSVRLKSKDFERARKDYEAALKQFNLYRKDHFTRTIPVWADVGYQLGQERYNRAQTLFSYLFDRFRASVDRLSSVCTELKSIPEKLQYDQDVDQFLSLIQSGTPYPGDIAFVDLAATLTTTDGSSATDTTNSNTLMWPPSLYPSVSAADLAALENAGFVRCSNNDGPVYAGTGSLYSTTSTGSGAAARRPSLTTAPGNGRAPALLRRFFSRRSRAATIDNGEEASTRRENPAYKSARLWRRSSRHLKRTPTQCSTGSLWAAQSTGNLSVATLGYSTDGDGKAEYLGQPAGCTIARVGIGSKHELRSPSCDRDVLDSSSFSDGSFESEQKEEKPVAYAETSILTGIQHLKTVDRSPPNSTHAAPLAEAENVSVSYAVGSQMNRSARGSVNGYGSAESSSCKNGSSGNNNLYSTSSVKSPTHSVASSPDYGKPNNILPPLYQRRTGMPLSSLSSDLSAGGSSQPAAASCTASPTNSYKAGHAFGPKAFATFSPSSSNDMQLHSGQPEMCHNSDRNKTDPGNKQHHYAQRSCIRSSCSQVISGCCTALYKFDAEGFEPCYLAFEKGERFYMIAPSESEDTSEWLRVLRVDGLELGFVPTGYMEQQHYAQPMSLPVPVEGASSPSTHHRHGSQEASTELRSPSSSSYARLPKSPVKSKPAYGRMPRTVMDTDL